MRFFLHCFSFLKIGSTCFPHFCLRVKRFDTLPCSRANAFTVGIRADKQKIQMIVVCLFIDLQHKTPDNPPILTNPPYLNARWLSRMNCSRSFPVRRVSVISAIFSTSFNKKGPAAKGFLSQLFRAHSTSYPTGGLQSFRFTIPYAAAYCPPMTNIQITCKLYPLSSYDSRLREAKNRPLPTMSSSIALIYKAFRHLTHCLHPNL